MMLKIDAESATSAHLPILVLANDDDEDFRMIIVFLLGD
jgi:hypothetical protein